MHYYDTCNSEGRIGDRYSLGVYNNFPIRDSTSIFVATVFFCRASRTVYSRSSRGSVGNLQSTLADQFFDIRK